MDKKGKNANPESQGSEQETTEALLEEGRVFRPLPQLVVDANLNPNDYGEAVKRGRYDLEGFWEEAAEDLSWFKKWDKVLDRSDAPFFKWFVGGKTNIAYNALDRHISTHRKNKVAIIHEREDGSRERMTYFDLYRAANKFANVLKALGIIPTSRISPLSCWAVPRWVPFTAWCMAALALRPFGNGSTMPKPGWW
jgi:acetyl-CoA synthetase